MKQALLLLLAGAILICFAACASPRTTEAPASSPAPIENADDEPVDVPVADIPLLIINDEPCVVTAAEGFNGAGFTSRVCGATATYSFQSSSPDVTWAIYVLDEAFPDIARYIPQTHKAALEGDGTLEIAEGKYLYIYCSENSFTTTESPSDATLTIDYAK